MASRWTLVLAFLIVLGTTADAQQNAKPVNVTGTVKVYEPGKRIEVEARSATHAYDLTSPDATYTISPDVAAGSKVKLTEKTEPAGHKTITIETAGKSDKPASEKPRRPMSEKPPVDLPPIR